MTDVGAMLRSAGDETSRVLIRIDRRRLTNEQRRELTEWAALLRINRGLSPNTVGNYVDDAAEMLEWLNAKGIAVDAVSGSDIEAWQQDLYVLGRQGNATRRLKLVAARGYFAWRETAGHGQSPARGLKGPKRARRQARKYTTEQLRKIFAACDLESVKGRRDAALLQFFYATGARRGEVAKLNLDQVELRERVGRVRFHGKGNKERTVSFEGPVVNSLRRWLADRDAMSLADRDAIFVGLTSDDKGRRLGISGINGVMRSATRKAGVKADGAAVALHRLRSSFATDLYDAGYDIRTIQLLLGHDDIRTTEQYIAISERQLKARMPADRIREVTGEDKNAVPRWAKRPGIAAKR